MNEGLQSIHAIIAGKSLDSARDSARESGAGRTSNAMKELTMSRRNMERAIDDETEAIFKNMDDPDMYTALNIRRPRDKRHLSKYEREKIYEWCLARDEKLMKEKTGGVQKRNDRYVNAKRKEDTLFQEVEKVAFNVPYGNFVRVSQMASEVSWRATTVPMGFARMSRNVPSYVGIPEEEVRERLWLGHPFTPEEIEKRKTEYLNKKLWEDIQSGAISVNDAPKEEEETGPAVDEDDDDKKKKSDDEEDGANADSDEEEVTEAAKEQAKKDSKTVRAMRKHNLETGNFVALRSKVTIREKHASLKSWSFGCDPKFDFKDGFPATQELSLLGSPKGYVGKNKDKTKGKKEQVTSRLFVRGPRDNMEQLYIKFREKHMLIKAKTYVEDCRRIERERIEKERLREERRRLRRLQGKHDDEDSNADKRGWDELLKNQPKRVKLDDDDDESDGQGGRRPKSKKDDSEAMKKRKLKEQRRMRDIEGIRMTVRKKIVGAMRGVSRSTRAALNPPFSSPVSVPSTPKGKQKEGRHRSSGKSSTKRDRSPSFAASDVDFPSPAKDQPGISRSRASRSSFRRSSSFSLMFDDGFDPGSSRKEEDGDTGDAAALAIITALDTEDREWSEGGSAVGSRPGSATHRRPSGSSPSPGRRSERERRGSEMEMRGGGSGSGKSPSKGKSGSASKGKGKGKSSKGGPGTRHERSPRERARSFSNLPYPEPAVPGQWVPSKLLDEHDALVHAHDAVMVPGQVDSTPGPADSSNLDTKSKKKKKKMVKNSPASALSALASLGYRPSPVKTTPRKGSFVAHLAAPPLDVSGVSTPFASVGVHGTMALAADSTAAAVGASSGRGSEGGSRGGSVGSDHPSLVSQGGTKHHKRKRVGSVTFGGAVPPLMLPSALTSNNNDNENVSASTDDKAGDGSATTSLKLKRKPSNPGQGPDEGLPSQQQQLVAATSSKSVRNLFGGLMLRRMTSTKISSNNNNNNNNQKPPVSGAEGETKEVKGMWGLVRGQYVEVEGQGVRKNSLRAMASALGRRASDSVKSFGSHEDKGGAEGAPETSGQGGGMFGGRMTASVARLMAARDAAAKEIDNVRNALGMQAKVTRQQPGESGILVDFIQRRTKEMAAEKAQYDHKEKLSKPDERAQRIAAMQAKKMKALLNELGVEGVEGVGGSVELSAGQQSQEEQDEEKNDWDAVETQEDFVSKLPILERLRYKAGIRYGEAMVALKALAALVRAEFRQRIKAIIDELKETDAGQDAIRLYIHAATRTSKLLREFEHRVYIITGVKVDWGGAAALRNLQRHAGRAAIEGDSLIKDLMEQEQMEELEKALLSEEEAEVEAEFCENLYRLRRNEQYRENFIHDQLNKVVVLNEDSTIYIAEDLITAAKRGDYRLCIDIIEHPFYPITPNAQDVNHQTATYAALLCILSRTDNSLFDVENTSLFTQFVKLFKRSKKDQYRLDYVVKILLDKGGDVNFVWEERGEDGMAMIHRACDIGAFPFVKWLMNKGAKTMIKTSVDRLTPLMFAVRNNHIDIALYLLDVGNAMPSVTHMDAQGNTALHYCCMGKGSGMLAQVLLICGCPMNIRNRAGRLAMDEARVHEQADVIAVLSRYIDRTLDREVRIQFNTLVFPKGGVLDVAAFDGMDIGAGVMDDEGSSALGSSAVGDDDDDEEDEED